MSNEGVKAILTGRPSGSPRSAHEHRKGARMMTLAARSNFISQRVMKPLPVDVFEAARELRDSMESSRLSLADRERLLRICDTAHRLGRRALGAGITSD